LAVLHGGFGWISREGADFGNGGGGVKGVCGNEDSALQNLTSTITEAADHKSDHGTVYIRLGNKSRAGLGNATVGEGGGGGGGGTNML